MCLSPLHIINPSKWIDPSLFQRLMVDVPCGRCSECLKEYQNEWRNRGYYEALGCLSSGSDHYILMDCLTYRNGSLPHLSDLFDVPCNLDFPCFSLNDIQHFLARLRRDLSYSGYDVDDGLRYFVACEYGDDIRRSRRPHYHILFFVSCDLSPEILSRSVAKAWVHGRTDGLPYKSLAYVQNHCVLRNVMQSGRAVVSYVTKYCTKQFSYNSLVSRRLEKIKAFDFDLYLNCKSFIKCGHWQSKSFGHKYLIEICGKENLLRDGRFKIVSSSGYPVYVSLHKSLQRKLLYDHYRDEFGQVHWLLNQDGFDYKKRHWSRSLDYLSGRVVDSDLSYREIRSKCFDFLYKTDRFNVTDNVSDIIDYSYNVSKGLRNYCCHDKEFLHKKVFLGSDFGSKSRGFRSGQFKRVGSLVDFGPCDYITFKDLSNYVVASDNRLIDKYFADRIINGDDGLSVMKLKHRLNNIFNSIYV